MSFRVRGGYDFKVRNNETSEQCGEMLTRKSSACRSSLLDEVSARVVELDVDCGTYTASGSSHALTQEEQNSRKTREQ